MTRAEVTIIKSMIEKLPRWDFTSDEYGEGATIDRDVEGNYLRRDSVLIALDAILASCDK